MMKAASNLTAVRVSRQLKLAQSAAGQVLLHVLCLVRDHKFQWHWAGSCREFHHVNR